MHIVLSASLLAALLACAVHARYIHRRGTTRTMGAIFTIMLPGPLLILTSLLYFLTVSVTACIQGVALYLALAAVYIQTYPAIQAASPSLVILSFLSRRTDGATKDEIRQLICTDDPINQRLIDLIEEQLVCEQDGRLELCRSGRTLGRFFSVYRRLLGLTRGKG